MLGMNLQSPGFVYLCVCWFWFALSYARRRRHVSTPALVAISILPTVSLVLALTNEWHRARLAVAAHSSITPDTWVGRRIRPVADGSRRLRVRCCCSPAP